MVQNDLHKTISIYASSYGVSLDDSPVHRLGLLTSLSLKTACNDSHKQNKY